MAVDFVQNQNKTASRMLRFAIFILSLIPFISFSSNSCKCEEDLLYTIHYLEENLPGFTDNVTSENEAEYQTFKQQLLQKARETETEHSCFRLLTQYVEFFKDNHTRIEMKSSPIDESKPRAIKKFRKSGVFIDRERIVLPPLSNLNNDNDSITGVYYSLDSTYQVAVLASPNAFRDYVGVIVSSKAPVWEKGQVKFELKSVGENQFHCYAYMRNHSLRMFANFDYVDGILGDTWCKTTRSQTVNNVLCSDPAFHFKLLNDSVVYLRIPSFSSNQTATINALYESADSTIRNTPYLIVDVRENGGGSDSNCERLLEYMYTHPFPLDTVQFYATPDNNALWKSWIVDAKKDPKNFTAEDVEWFQEEYDKYVNAPPYSFVNRTNGDLVELDSSTTYPRKIAIIQNKFCASSCESLLYFGQNSSKTILVGENSGGYVGYGEVGSTRTPKYGYELYCTMTRYSNQRSLETIGFTPDYLLEFDTNWIDQTVKILLGK